MNIPHRQTQTAVGAPEGVAQRREFRLLGVEREMTTMKMLLRFKKTVEDRKQEGHANWGEANENIATPCVLACASTTRVIGMAGSKGVGKRKHCESLKCHAHGS